MTRFSRLAACAAPLALAISAPAVAQDLQNRPVAPPPASDAAPDPAPAAADQIRFSADTLEYDDTGDIVTATGDVRLFREDQRLRADKVVWNRKTGRVVATGGIAVTNAKGDTAYGDQIELTDSLRDGVVENMLVVLEQGGRLAAVKGARAADGTLTLDTAAYTPCSVLTSDGCPKEPSWKITAIRVVYRPDKGRIYYDGGRLDLFGLPALPLPHFSHPIGGNGESGFLTPDIRISRSNGLEVAAPFYVRFAPDKALTVTPWLFTGALPMLETNYEALTDNGAFRLTAYATVSRRSDDFVTGVTGTEETFRGYLDGVAHFQLSPEWSVTGSLRVATDKTFLRRYDLSRDDRLRSTVNIERIGDGSYFSVAGWAVQTLRINDAQDAQPLALPEIDWRRRFTDLAGGVLQVQANTLALSRSEGEDTQRAFASLQWDLRRLTPWGQIVTLTAYGRGDLYRATDTLEESVPSYRGLDGFHGRAIGALAVDVQWPLVGELWGGMQRLTPRVQIVASPHVANLSIPNEDARAVDLEDSNLFALNRFPGYDRWEDSTRVTYGLDWSADLPNLSITSTIGQSYRLSERSSILPDGTGLSDRVSDIVGRTEVRWRDLVSVIARYRLDKDDFTLRRNEIDATIGSRKTYLLLGYLKLNRDITEVEADLQDHEEARIGGRVQFAKFWSAFASAIVDLTDRKEDPLSLADGFEPVRHRLGVAYEDDCLKLGLTWKRDYEEAGDARAGNSYLLTLAFKNLGR